MASLMVICNNKNKTHFCKNTCLHGRPHPEHNACTEHEYCSLSVNGAVHKCERVKPAEMRELIKEGRMF